MNLILTIIKSPQGVSLAQTQRVFSEQGGDIGRSDRNAWALSDPERYISSTHCRIEFENGRFFLVDKSTNGTFLNHSTTPIGKGEREALADGMTFSVGDYEFAVRVAQQDESQAMMEPSIPGVLGPFDNSDHILSQPPVQVTSREYDPEMPLASDAELYSPIHISPHHESVLPGQENILDPLRALDQVNRKQKSDLFSDHGADNFSSRSSGHAPVSDEAFTPPKVKRNEAIPEDWDNTEYGYNPKKRPAAGGHTGAKDKHVTPARAKQASAKHPAHKQSVAAQRTGAGRTAGGTSSPRAPIDVHVAARAVDNDLLAAMGMDRNSFSPEQLAQMNDIVGQFVRHTVEGLLKVLRARSTIKNELRLGVTTVQPRDNNPIKFSADVDDALEHLFLRQSKAYMPPIASVNESFETILDHQVAVLAGMRAAFKSLIQKFDPVLLATKFETQVGSGLFSGKKLKHWDAYTEFYNAQVQDLDNSFQHLFGDEFVKAYESQLVQLSIARRKERKDS